MRATAKAFRVTPQAVQARLKRGTFPLQPVARAGRRLFFDKAQVERAGEIVTANSAQP